MMQRKNFKHPSNLTATLTQAQQFITELYNRGACLNRMVMGKKTPMDKAFTRNMGYQRRPLRELLEHNARGGDIMLTLGSLKLFGIDIDKITGEHGVEWFTNILDAAGYPWFVVRSANRGQHLYFPITDEAEALFTIAGMSEKRQEIDSRNGIKWDYRCSGGYLGIYHIAEQWSIDMIDRLNEGKRADVDFIKNEILAPVFLKRYRKQESSRKRKKQIANGELKVEQIDGEFLDRLTHALLSVSPQASQPNANGWIHSVNCLCSGIASASNDQNASYNVDNGVYVIHDGTTPWSAFRLAKVLDVPAPARNSGIGKKLTDEYVAARQKLAQQATEQFDAIIKQEAEKRGMEVSEFRDWNIRRIDVNRLRACYLAGKEGRSEAMLLHWLNDKQLAGHLNRTFAPADIYALKEQPGHELDLSEGHIRRILGNLDNFAVKRIKHGQYEIVDGPELQARYFRRLLPSCYDFYEQELDLAPFEANLYGEKTEAQVQAYADMREHDKTYRHAERRVTSLFEDLQSIGDPAPDWLDHSCKANFICGWLWSQIPHGTTAWNIELSTITGLKNINYWIDKSSEGDVDDRFGMYKFSRPFHLDASDESADEEVREKAKTFHQPVDGLKGVSGRVIRYNTYIKGLGDSQIALVYCQSTVLHEHALEEHTVDYLDAIQLNVEEWEHSTTDYAEQCRKAQEDIKRREAKQFKALKEQYADRLVPKYSQCKDAFNSIQSSDNLIVNQSARMLDKMTDEFTLKNRFLFQAGEEMPLTFAMILANARDLQYTLGDHTVNEARLDPMPAEIEAEPAESKAESKEYAAEYAEWESQSNDIPF